MNNSIIILPAYQPDEKLIEIAAQMLSNNCNVITVDDGSGKDYSHIFNRLPEGIILLRHNNNCGKGKAIKTAINYIISHEQLYYKNSVIGIMDCDGQHTPDDMMKVISAASTAGGLIIGARKINKTMPLRSKAGNICTRILFTLLSGKRITDTQSGLRAFDISTARELSKVDGERYEYEMNVLIFCIKNNIPVSEIPITTIYSPGNKCSHFRAIADSLRIYKDLFKFAGSSFISFLADYILFCLFMLVFNCYAWGATASNVSARIISCILNYYLNSRYVFIQKGTVGSFLKYIGLAAFILLMNSILLNGYTKLGIPVMFAKLISELTLFIISFAIQKLLIFKRAAKAN